MLTPPFKLSAGGMAALGAAVSAGALQSGDGQCCGHDHVREEHGGAAHAQARTRLYQLDTHLHCSVIGTCLSPAELRKLMGRHMDIKGKTDLELHHQAVGLAHENGDLSKAIHKALDQRHAAVIKGFAAAQDEAALEAAWKQAWQQGEIPGAYWALLTHKCTSFALRQMAFGEVHMLSHLMGSANRHELKRFVALEKENLELQDKLERERQRHHQSQLERDALAGQLRQQSLDFEARLSQLRTGTAPGGETRPADAGALVGMHTERRERAERATEQAWAEAGRLQQMAEQLQQRVQWLAEELAAAEKELHRAATQPQAPDAAQQQALQGRKLLYVGGRPSSTPAIRDHVQRHGGEFLHHDGGLETRKGLLAAQLPRVDLVVFPVDCVDHDSVVNLKRLSERHGVPFIALRTASLASFAATVARELAPPDAGTRTTSASHFCLRHG
ncbi:DUF2325 domain-containing protein [Delftia acidovorans]|uniref:DUF2325 domain-containing protein n=1 Tax=Delftia acidovorans TaxID=80866 RepID=UPI00242DDC5D|nr:DUF2325 domain-containing protein [Delftia acidovorans]